MTDSLLWDPWRPGDLVSALRPEILRPDEASPRLLTRSPVGRRQLVQAVYTKITTTTGPSEPIASVMDGALTFAAACHSHRLTSVLIVLARTVVVAVGVESPASLADTETRQAENLLGWWPSSGRDRVIEMVAPARGEPYLVVDCEGLLRSPTAPDVIPFTSAVARGRRELVEGNAADFRFALDVAVVRELRGMDDPFFVPPGVESARPERVPTTGDVSPVPARTIEEYRRTIAREWFAQDAARFVPELLTVAELGGADPEEGLNLRCGLADFLARRRERIVTVIGASGSGKTMALRHLHAGYSRTMTTALVQLRGYLTTQDQRPLDWLAANWRQQQPRLPALPELFKRGNFLLILDGLNEISSVDDRQRLATVAAWKRTIHEIVDSGPGNRVVVGCRTVDLEMVLGSEDHPAVYLEIRPLTAQQIAVVLRGRGRYASEAEVLAAAERLQPLASTALVLAIALSSSMDAPDSDRAALLTRVVRNALRREVERDNPRLRAERGLLAPADIRFLALSAGGSYDLPGRGDAIPALQRLAAWMQAGMADDTPGARPDAALTSISTERAEPVLGLPNAAEYLRIGMELNLLAEDLATDEIRFSHQLVREYFAARQFIRQPDFSLLDWKVPTHDQAAIDLLPPGEPVPSLPANPWEEPVVLAGLMARDRADFVENVADVNEFAAALCAGEPGMRLPSATLDRLRAAMYARMVSTNDDIRSRMSAGLRLGHLGDPRFRAVAGASGSYVPPSLVTVPGGDYLLGSDADEDALPLGMVQVGSFSLGRYSVTNAEFACFMVAGGYDDPAWWVSPAAQDWFRGVGTNAGHRHHLRYLLSWLSLPDIGRMHGNGNLSDDEVKEFRRLMRLSPAKLEKDLLREYPDQRISAPRLWHDHRFNNPIQPVVGVSHYEAEAYCHWLSSMTGTSFRLPTEFEWEAAVRGVDRSTFACDRHDSPTHANLGPLRLRRPTPVGMFEADSRAGLQDVCGNTSDRTASRYGPSDYALDRSDQAAPRLIDIIVIRGSKWRPPDRKPTYRVASHPATQPEVTGFRLATTATDGAY